MSSILHSISLWRGLSLLFLFCVVSARQGPDSGNDIVLPIIPCLTDDPSCNDTPDFLPAKISDLGNGAQETPINEEEEEETIDYDYAYEDDVEEVLNCLFNAVPLIGGEWLTKLARMGFTDRFIIEGAYSFLAGGRLMARYVDPQGTSQATRFVGHIGYCLEEAEKSEDSGSSQTGEPESDASSNSHPFKSDANSDSHPYKSDASSDSHPNESDAIYSNSHPNAVEADEGTVSGTILETSRSIPGSSRSNSYSSIVSRNRKKRNINRSSGYGGSGGGYGGGGYGKDSLLGFNLLGLLVVGALITYLVYLLTM